MSLSYTTGNWTVESHEVDTLSSTKNLALPDLSYATDFSVVSEAAGDVRLQNTSGNTLEPVEQLRYAKEKVADIYRQFPTLKQAQLPSAVGARVLAESAEILSAANSVTGAEYEIPIRIWTCVESSTHNAITGQALLWALLRHVSQLFGTGSVGSDQLVKLFRGDLDPTK